MKILRGFNRKAWLSCRISSHFKSPCCFFESGQNNETLFRVSVGIEICFVSSGALQDKQLCEQPVGRKDGTNRLFLWILGRLSVGQVGFNCYHWAGQGLQVWDHVKITTPHPPRVSYTLHTCKVYDTHQRRGVVYFTLKKSM